MVWRSTIDLDNLTALDVHVHAGTSAKASPAEATSGPTRDDTLARATQRSGVGGQTPDQTAAYYRERKIACAIWGVDTGGARGARPGAVSNDEMLEAAERNSDVFIPFVMVDPWRDHAGADEAQRLIQAGARGFKFVRGSDQTQQFFIAFSDGDFEYLVGFARTGTIPLPHITALISAVTSLYHRVAGHPAL